MIKSFSYWQFVFIKYEKKLARGVPRTRVWRRKKMYIKPLDHRKFTVKYAPKILIHRGVLSICFTDFIPGPAWLCVMMINVYVVSWSKTITLSWSKTITLPKATIITVSPLGFLKIMDHLIKS